MEILIIVMICLPFLSALLLSIFKNNTIRQIVTYVSAAGIIGLAVAFAVQYFTAGSSQLYFFTETHAIDYGMIGVETFLVVLITVLSIKYKQYYAALLSIAQTVLMFWYELGGKEPKQEIHKMYVDQLTVIMVLIVAVVGTLITVYACGYMNDYHNHHKEFKDRRRYFFSLLYVFLGAMFGLVLSNSLIWLYFFWEITSVVSFLLIGYTRTEEAIHNCFRALWMNLLGGCGFAAGIVWAGMKFSVTDMQSLILCDGKLVVVPVILLSFAALTKSAQMPFSKWLLGAMVAPTPSSALLHSATMVKAGVYLLLRLSPVLADTYAGTMVSLVGGFTFLIMSMLAITVSDGKKVLAYSTISNLGLITACAGVGAKETLWAGMFLLIFHAISKSLLFQTVGAIENATGSRDIETMHGLVRRHPHLAWTLVIGIAGMFLAPFGMLISKWAALKAFIDSGSVVLILFVCFGSATTLFYWTKWIATVLASKNNDSKAKNTTSANQWTSILLHSAFMIVLCFTFPFLSIYVIEPYIKTVFNNATAVISSDNIIIMMIMLVAIFLVPGAAWLTAKETRYKKAARYINGVNAGDQMNYIDSMGEKKRFFLANWYMEDIFGEKKLWNPSIVISILMIIALMVISIGGAF
ncbi:MAG: NADH-quinone oxidoreductase subunit L [Clostridium sp.]|nr:NADH-quinone oxidoreductase subunit L [Clostridium sp.]